MSWKKTIWIAGVARSGTSWVGQIFNSHPSVRFRFQPLFSHEFKNVIDEDSTARKYVQFLDQLWESNADFLMQRDKVESGQYPNFQKSCREEFLVFKENRYQSLIEPFLRNVPDSFLVGVIRHPCAVLNSWRKNPKEFPEGSIFEKEWRFGNCKNKGNEDYFGFYKWREVANLYLDLADKYPERVAVLHYEKLVQDRSNEVKKLFDLLGLEFDDQTSDFLNPRDQKHCESYYSVFKDREVATKWRAEFDASIAEEISDMLNGTRLERFLDNSS